MGVQNPNNIDHIEYVEVAVEMEVLVTRALVVKRLKSSLKVYKMPFICGAAEYSTTNSRLSWLYEWKAR